MSVIHLRVNECGIEIIEDDNAPLIERVTGLATDAAVTLQQAVSLIPLDSKHLATRIRLLGVLTWLRQEIREIDGAS